MVRIDAWEVTDPEEVGTLDCGFPRDFEEKYTWGKQLGKGGFGNVRVVVEKRTGKEFACKSISKRLDVPNFSPQRQAAHMENIKREVAVLRRLQGTLNVAQLKEALEDNASVHIIMEYCRGGELWNYIGKLHHYSERTVASYMRAVLRTVVQCHNQKILHRDIKPGNFMLLEDDPLSPVKAIDFGLAVFFEPSKLPRKDLGLEGTPWFMSPETLSSQVGPPADVWAVGVMAYQLLSGHLPFDDHQHPNSPALSRVWKAILTEDVVFKSKAWREVSEPAKDFVRTLLAKDPAKRPTAKQALQHPWLVGGKKEERNVGAPLRNTVVQRIQRFGQGNVLKRTIFELIAQEIIKAAPETPDTSIHSHASFSPLLPGSQGKREADGSSHASQHAAQLVSTIKRRKSQRALAVLAHGPGGGAIEGPPLIHRDHHSVHGGLEYFAVRGDSVHNGQEALQRLAQEGRPGSVHGRDDYWRLLNAALQNDSVRGHSNFLRNAPRCDEERFEQRKAARLALDTSKRNSKDYTNFLKQCSSPSVRRRSGEEGMDIVRQHSRQLPSPSAGATAAQRPAFPVPDSNDNTVGSGEERVRGRSAYRMFLESQGGASAPQETPAEQSHSPTASPSQSPGDEDKEMRDASGREGSGKSGQRKHVSFTEPSADVSMEDRRQSNEGQSPTHSLPPGYFSNMKEMRDLMRKLSFTRESEAVSEEQLAEGLRQLGYDLKPDEVKILAARLEPTGQAGGISKSAFLASQIDWYREDLRELWIEAARKVFAELERDSHGKLSAATLTSLVREKVPETEVEYAVEDALMDAGYAEAEELDFDAFLRMLRPASSMSLDQFEPRINLPSSQDNLQAQAIQSLSTVAEET